MGSRTRRETILPRQSKSPARNSYLPSSQDRRLVLLGKEETAGTSYSHIPPCMSKACASASNFVESQHADSAAHYARTVVGSMKSSRSRPQHVAAVVVLVFVIIKLLVTAEVKNLC